MSPILFSFQKPSCNRSWASVALILAWQRLTLLMKMGGQRSAGLTATGYLSEKVRNLLSTAASATFSAMSRRTQQAETTPWGKHPMATQMFQEHANTMPPTLNKTRECQIIRKIFSNRENTDRAIEAFKNLEISPQDLVVVVPFDDEQTKDLTYQKFHDATRRWLVGWANRGASQTRPTVMPFLRGIPVGATRSKYHE